MDNETKFKPIDVFPDKSGSQTIKRDKLEEYLKEVRSAMLVEHYSGNDAASINYTKTLAIACQKLFNELEELKLKIRKEDDEQKVHY